jgi:hypothetical protein
MKSGLLLGISHLRSNRTGAAGRASSGQAIRLAGFEVLTAGSVIVGALRRERGDRAGRKAWPVATILARVCRALAGRKFQELAQAERSAIRVPKTPFGMDQQTERRTVNGLGRAGRLTEATALLQRVLQSGRDLYSASGNEDVPATIDLVPDTVEVIRPEPSLRSGHRSHPAQPCAGRQPSDLHPQELEVVRDRV